MAPKPSSEAFRRILHLLAVPLEQICCLESGPPSVNWQQNGIFTCGFLSVSTNANCPRVMSLFRSLPAGRMAAPRTLSSSCNLGHFSTAHHRPNGRFQNEPGEPQVPPRRIPSPVAGSFGIWHRVPSRSIYYRLSLPHSTLLRACGSIGLAMRRA